MQEQSPESIEQRMTRILKRVIIGLGIAIAIVGVGIGVLIYQRSVANKDDKAGLPVAADQTQAPATPPAASPAPAPSATVPPAPGQIAGDFGAVRPPMAPRTAPRAAGAEGPALLPGERVVTLAAAGEDVMMVAEGEGGAQVLVVIDRSSGLLIRRVPLNAAASR